MPRLVLGPLLRHVGADDATIWVETDVPCEVEVCGCRDRTFEIEGHHFALVHVTGLEPEQARPYEVHLDGERVWPLDTGWPPSCIRTIGDDHDLRVAFGSCRVAHPNEPPWTLSKDEDPRGREHDALRALAMRMRAQDEEDWPHLLLLLGDQVYADEVPVATAEFIAARRDVSVPPGEEVADFEEYCRLYYDSWTEPAVRWLLSTMPTAMIFDDHDVHDDWNTSRDWVRDIRGHGWWDERIVGGFMAYWVYQHLGNLSPEDRMDDATYCAVRDREGDAGPIVREFAFAADREVAGARWSYRRDLGRTRIVMMDSRAGRVLEPGARHMVDAEEWDCIERWTEGTFDHILLGTSLPAFLGRGMHHLEAWNEAVSRRGVGHDRRRPGREAASRPRPRALGRVRRLAARPRGPRWSGSPPGATATAARRPVSSCSRATSTTPTSPARGSTAAPATAARSTRRSARRCAIRSTRRERRAIRIGMSRPAERIAGALAKAAGVAEESLTWTIEEGPWFDNQVATIEIDGRNAWMVLDKTVNPPDGPPRLERVMRRQLT